jgi:hypothetical protein
MSIQSVAVFPHIKNDLAGSRSKADEIGLGNALMGPK